MASGPSTAELALRLVLSLGTIVGLLVLAARLARRHGGVARLGGLAGTGGRSEPAIRVVERRSLTRTASVALVEVGDTTMVVGVSEHGVSLLAGTDRPSGNAAEREAKWTAPPEPDPVAAMALPASDRPARMNFVDALRELTVRKA